jgi:hypothetical protein
MTNDPDRDCRNADAVADLLVEAIESATPSEVREHLTARYGDSAKAVAAGRATIRAAMKEVAERRRIQIKQQLDHGARAVEPVVQNLSREELLKVLEQHVANDTAAAPMTLAARSGKGELDDEELRSVVRDILLLRSDE